jgi:hypothetical protein
MITLLIDNRTSSSGTQHRTVFEHLMVLESFHAYNPHAFFNHFVQGKPDATTDWFSAVPFAYRLLVGIVIGPWTAKAQRFTGRGRLRVALAKQPLFSTGTSTGPIRWPTRIRQLLDQLGTVVRIDEAALTLPRLRIRGGKKLGMALGHFADIVARNDETDISP